MLPTFPDRDSVAVEVRTGQTHDGNPIIYLGDNFFKIPQQLFEELAELPGFVNASRQEQIKTTLYSIINAAK